MLFKYAKGATPLSPDEIYNLIPSHLTTQKQLDEWEQYNIVQATNWAFNRKRTDLLSIIFAKALHKKMFDKTWIWAGSLRKRQTNMGVASIYIPQELKLLFDDIQFQIEHDSFPIREIGVRLHHRLVFIHPFPNGNSRFSRLMAELLMCHNGEASFTWGICNLTNDSEIREEYLSALRQADNGDYSNLIKFADS